MSIRGDLRTSKKGKPYQFNGKRWITLCSTEGCNKQAVKGGVCIAHGAKTTRCSTEGCTNQAQKGGICIKHGAKTTRCSTEGCTNQAQKGGVCITHGAKKKRCSTEGCTNQAQKGGVCCKHGAKHTRCSTEGCTNQALKGGICIAHGAKKKKRCSTKGCEKQAIKGGICIKHGAKTECSVEDCTKHAQKGGICVTHGAKTTRCSTEGCTNQALKGGICVTHGAVVKPPKRCSHKDCEKQALKGGVCVTHGAKTTRCSHKDCKKQAQKGGKCIQHGGGKRCPNCVDWIDSRVGWKKYDGYCATCFKRIFPTDSRSKKIYEKTKEIKVRNFLNEKFKGFIHDKPLWTKNCKCNHRRRVDFRKIIDSTMLCIEVDERQHSSYNEKDEEIRYNDLFMLFFSKWIFIRFNPDSYIDSKGKRVNPPLDKRLEVLESEINNQIKRIRNEENKELLEINKLYYNE